MKYLAAVFDLDGTLLDTLEDLAGAVDYSLERYNLPKRSLEEVRGFIGGGIKTLVERAVPENTPEALKDEILDCFSAYYLANSAVKTKAYDGMSEAIDALKAAGCKLAVISNKPDAVTRSLAERYFPSKFDFCAGMREGARKKPCPDTVFEALRALGVTEKDSVYIGDSEVDILTAKNAGMNCISVSWGFRSKDYLKTLTDGIIVDCPDDLLKNIF